MNIYAVDPCAGSQPYQYHAFPKCIYFRDGSSVIVKDAAELASHQDYKESPAEFLSPEFEGPKLSKKELRALKGQAE